MKELAKKLRKLLVNKDIIDIVIFGSKAKGAIAPTDLDIAVITDTEVDKKKLKDSLKKEVRKEIDLQVLSAKDYDKFIWITIMREGYSVKHNSYLSEVIGISPIVLYKYSLKSLTLSKKVMFERAIKNFKNIKKLSNRVVLVPTKDSGEFSDFLKNWGIDLDGEEYGLLPLVRKSEL